MSPFGPCGPAGSWPAPKSAAIRVPFFTLTPVTEFFFSLEAVTAFFFNCVVPTEFAGSTAAA
jgi:hypothetical protein